MASINHNTVPTTEFQIGVPPKEIKSQVGITYKRNISKSYHIRDALGMSGHIIVAR